MDGFAISPTDIGVAVVLLISAILALSRGFVREVLALSTWVGAAIITYVTLPPAKPPVRAYFKKWFDTEQTLFADIAAGTAIFLTVLVILALISSWISKKVQDSSIGPLDRSLGFLFGLLRGAVVLCLAYLLLLQAMPPKDHPEWITSAKSVPLMQRGAKFIVDLTPKDIADSLEKFADNATEKAKESSNNLPDLMSTNPTGGGNKGYDKTQTKDMDRLMENKSKDSDQAESN